MNEKRMNKQSKLALVVLIVTGLLTLYLIGHGIYVTNRHDRIMEQHFEQLVMEVNKLRIITGQQLDLDKERIELERRRLDEDRELRMVFQSINSKIKTVK